MAEGIARAHRDHREPRAGSLEERRRGREAAAVMGDLEREGRHAVRGRSSSALSPRAPRSPVRSSETPRQSSRRTRDSVVLARGSSPGPGVGLSTVTARGQPQALAGGERPGGARGPRERATTSSWPPPAGGRSPTPRRRGNGGGRRRARRSGRCPQCVTATTSSRGSAGSRGRARPRARPRRSARAPPGPPSTSRPRAAGHLDEDARRPGRRRGTSRGAGRRRRRQDRVRARRRGPRQPRASRTRRGAAIPRSRASAAAAYQATMAVSPGAGRWTIAPGEGGGQPERPRAARAEDPREWRERARPGR